MRILKYERMVDDEIDLQLPAGSTLLCVGTQRPRHICFWVLTGVGPMQTYYFSVYGTGHDCDRAPQNYKGTVFDGKFVWHIFEGRYARNTANASSQVEESRGPGLPGAGHTEA